MVTFKAHIEDGAIEFYNGGEVGSHYHIDSSNNRILIVGAEGSYSFPFSMTIFKP